MLLIKVVMFERDGNIVKSKIFDSKLTLLWAQKCHHDRAAKMSRPKSLWRQLVVRIDNMAESERKVPKSGGRYCVAGLPNNESCKDNTYTQCISMHTFPMDPGLRAQWVKYVQKHRVDFGEPVSVCGFVFGTLWNGLFCQSFGMVSWLCEKKRPRPWCNPYQGYRCSCGQRFNRAPKATGKSERIPSHDVSLFFISCEVLCMIWHFISTV